MKHSIAILLIAFGVALATVRVPLDAQVTSTPAINVLSSQAGSGSEVVVTFVIVAASDATLRPGDVSVLVRNGIGGSHRVTARDGPSIAILANASTTISLRFPVPDGYYRDVVDGSAIWVGAPSPPTATPSLKPSASPTALQTAKPQPIVLAPPRLASAYRPRTIIQNVTAYRCSLSHPTTTGLSTHQIYSLAYCLDELGRPAFAKPMYRMLAHRIGSNASSSGFDDASYSRIWLFVARSHFARHDLAGARYALSRALPASYGTRYQGDVSALNNSIAIALALQEQRAQEQREAAARVRSALSQRGPPVSADVGGEAPEFNSESEARSHCPSDTVVWLNTNSGIYHYAGMRWYNNTNEGAFVCEKEALAAGDRATENGQ